MAVAFDAAMSPSDAVLWDIEHDPVLRTTIVAVALLDRAPDWDRLMARLARGSQDVPRLRQRVEEPLLRVGPPRWVEDDAFDLSFHVRRVRPAEPANLDSVLELARTAAMTPFDHARPLWEFTVVEGLEDGRAALIQKLHHSLTDGVGGIELALMLVDLERDVDEQETQATTARHWSRLEVTVAALADQVRVAVGLPARLQGVAAGAAGAGRHPGRALADAAATASSIGRLLQPAGEPCSPLLRGRSLGRELRAFELPFADLKAAGAAAGGTVNDAYLAAVVGGLAAYHEKQGAEVDRLRVTMPVDQRADDDAAGGNRFVPLRFTLPAGIADPAERIRVMGTLSRAWRGERALAVTDALAGVLDRLPVPMVTGLFGRMLKGVDFVATNVPGIPVPVYIAGAAVEREWAFAPPSGASLAVALLSHVGTACIGLVADTAAVSDVPALADCLETSFAEIADLGR
jgi:diacylglycerol O-acyltransferase / wax synthase